jgi:carbonic anhydrase
VKTVDIIYRYEVRDTPAKPFPSDRNAALLRLDHGNREFAALLDHVKDESGVIQQVIQVDPRDLGLLPNKNLGGTLKLIVVLGS